MIHRATGPWPVFLVSVQEWGKLAILPEVATIHFATAPAGWWIRSEDAPPEGMRRRYSHLFHSSNLQHSCPGWNFDHGLLMYEPICLEAASRSLEIAETVEDHRRETLGLDYLWRNDKTLSSVGSNSNVQKYPVNHVSAKSCQTTRLVRLYLMRAAQTNSGGVNTLLDRQILEENSSLLQLWPLALLAMITRYSTV